MAVVLVAALAAIGVAIASPQTIRSAFAPAPVSTLPGGGTTAPNTKTSAAGTSSTTRTTTRTRTTTTRTTTPSIQPVPRGQDALGPNPFYQAGGIAKQACSPPGWPSDGSAGQAFYNAALPCLERAWEPLFERVRMDYEAPTVMAPTGASTTSPCGTTTIEEAAAFYCSANETIYMPIAAITDADGLPLIFFSVFAHEFGHHVQNLNGTMDASWSRERAAGVDTPAGYEWSRRLELQAQCFSGMAVESVLDSGGIFTGGDAGPVLNRYAYTGSITHGNAEHRQSWWSRGRGAPAAVCNTYTASSAEVA